MEHLAVSSWSDQRVFVTGATGLLGSWLAEELLRQGATVTCLIRDWVPGARFIRQGLLDQVNVVRGSLEDYPLLVRTLNEYEIDSVFHVGAQTIVETAVRAPLSTFETNIRGTWNLLEACRSCSQRIRRIVIASSDKAYGAHERLPYCEDTPLLGRYPYDVSKACADLLATSYVHTYRTPVAITRCANLFGGGDLNFNRLVPGTIRSVVEDKAPIIRSDGLFIRDYLYVRDAVGAYLRLAATLPDERFIGQAFNFGTERPISVIEMVNLILEATGKTELQPVVLNQALDEIHRQYLDCSKARRMMDWSPNYQLEEALRETISWYREWLSKEAD